jgi:hypothetical protein
LIEHAAWKESMGLSAKPTTMTKFTLRLYNRFRSKIREIKDLKMLMHEIKHHKRQILKQIFLEKNFKVVGVKPPVDPKKESKGSPQADISESISTLIKS